MDKLAIYTLIHNQFQVLDHSGRLPFSVVFGLCRRSSDDTDSRPLVLDTRKSALDVPYALANNLLKLIVDDTDVTGLVINQLSGTEDSGAYLSLPSPVNREGNWKTGIVTYRYQIDPDSKLAALFESGKKYELKFASEDLGVKWYGYGERDDLVDSDGEPIKDTGKPKLIARPSHGRCTFSVVPSLPWPPELQTKLAFGGLGDGQCETRRPVNLKVTVRNRGAEPITVQTRGHQRFLVPWGPMQPEERAESRPRIIDMNASGALSSLRIVHKATGTVIRSPPPLGPSGPGIETDPRPKLDKLLTIKPEEPLVRLVDISKQLTGLPDGSYEVSLVRKGMWWCQGSRDEFGGDERVPHRLWNPVVPPIVLEFQDAVELRIESGKVVR